jgi:TetR/AcrR family transcriptional repressor of bet genes
VNIAYFVRALSDERLQVHAKEGIPALRSFFAEQISLAIQRGEVAPERDPEREAMLMISLVDGLTTYALLDVLTPTDALKLIDYHLGNLFI